MKTQKVNVHFVNNTLLNPTNPVKVNVIGAGGTGSQLMTGLARINHSLIALGHPGLSVRLFDDDVVTQANLGRQLFAEAEIGLKKSVALINRFNLFFGAAWKAIPHKYTHKYLTTREELKMAAITISCVDNVATRFEIATVLNGCNPEKKPIANQPLYWMDFGNSQYTGQVILSTIGAIPQPKSKKFNTVAALPMVTEEFADLLRQADETDDTPSCSLAEALIKQDLFINPALANVGASLLWSMFREGIMENRGFFMNVKDLRMQPIKVA